jgi:hypothetical protein
MTRFDSRSTRSLALHDTSRPSDASTGAGFASSTICRENLSAAPSYEICSRAAVPQLGIALAAVLALIVLVSTVLASVRANRSQLAVLGALGMTRGQSRRSLAWLGTAVSATLVAIAIPAAILLGSIVWRRTSDDLGTGPGAAIPWPLLGFVTTVFLAVGIVSATTVDASRRRSRLATLLRSE